jgi:hypothetical protein
VTQAPLPRLRSRLGFVLVEAGFSLLASTRLASRDCPETASRPATRTAIV